MVDHDELRGSGVDLESLVEGDGGRDEEVGAWAQSSAGGKGGRGGSGIVLPRAASCSPSPTCSMKYCSLASTVAGAVEIGTLAFVPWPSVVLAPSCALARRGSAELVSSALAQFNDLTSSAALPPINTASPPPSALEPDSPGSELMRTKARLRSTTISWRPVSRCCFPVLDRRLCSLTVARVSASVTLWAKATRTDEASCGKQGRCGACSQSRRRRTRSLQRGLLLRLLRYGLGSESRRTSLKLEEGGAGEPRHWQLAVAQDDSG